MYYVCTKTGTQTGARMSYTDEKMIKAMNAHKEGVQVIKDYCWKTGFQ